MIFNKRLIARALMLFVAPVIFSISVAHAEPLKILASIRPLALLTQDLVGDLPVEVTTLLPANADPHNWAMRISDRQSIADADLMLWLGPELEGFLVKALVGQAGETLQLGDLAGLQWPQSEAHDHHHDGHGRDMHLWLNPRNAAVVQTAIAARLILLKPEWKTRLQERLQQQIIHFEKLQQDIFARLQPYQNKGFLAYHDAYGHFVQAFQLHQLGAVNQTSEQRLSAKKLHELKTLSAQAQCLMVEKNDAPEKRVAKTLHLPVVAADGLAQNPTIETYFEFLMTHAAAFEKCLSMNK